jgi:hypothetical protein
MAGTTRTQTPSSQPAFDETRQEHNKLVDDDNYHHLNYPLSNAPALAIGTTTSKVKSVAAVTRGRNGAFTASKAATDDEWTLGVAGSNTNVATGSSQKYLLLRDAGARRPCRRASRRRRSPPSPSARCRRTSAMHRRAQRRERLGRVFIPGTTAARRGRHHVDVHERSVDPVAMLRAPKVTL